MKAGLQVFRWSHWLIFGLLLLAGTLLLLEVSIRMILPPAFFSPPENVYARHSDPEVGYTLVPNFRGFATGTFLKINSLGFRGDEWAPTPPAGKFRVALVGDSHAMGFGLPFVDSLGEALRSPLKLRFGLDAETLNFAVLGYNAVQKTAVLEKLALAYRPNLVVYFANSNDDEEARVATPEHWLVNKNTGITHHSPDFAAFALRHSPAWLLRAKTVSAVVLSYNYLLGHWRKVSVDVNRGDNTNVPYLPDAASPEFVHSSTIRPIRRAIEAARKKKLPFLLIYLEGKAEYLKAYRDLCTGQHIPCVDAYAALHVESWDEALQSYGLGWDSHLNAQASRIWAEEIGKELQATRTLALP